MSNSDEFKRDEIRQCLDIYAEKNDTDLVAYFGDITRERYQQLSRQLRKRKLRKNILLFLVTYGGDPNAAYRISRAFQECYNTIDKVKDDLPSSTCCGGSFTVYVDSICKSAGTIICLGADKLVMSEDSELGPIDVQLRKQDEVGERTSGLTPIQAIQVLETQSVKLFDRHFRELRNPENLGFSTRMAAGIASELTIGLLTAVYQQIDPIRLAEVDRSLKISGDYGSRLTNNGNLKDGAIEKLLAKYPSHNFVIDRTEAGELFSIVERPDQELIQIADYLRPIAEWTLDQESGFVVLLSQEPATPVDATPSSDAASPASGTTGASL